MGFRQSKTAVFDWTFLRLDSSGPSCYRQSSRFYSFCALPTGGWCEGVLLYGSRNLLAALCFALSPRATARRTLVPASWWLWAQPKAAKATFVKLHSAESRQSYSSRSRCWQHGIETARCWRAKLGMRHADLLREATAGIAKPASAPCMICSVVLGMCVAVWVCVWWWDERCGRFKKTGVKLFRPSFSTGGSSRKSRVFRLDPPVGIFSRKKFSRKSPFSTA